jgi:hypothetical protein
MEETPGQRDQVARAGTITDERIHGATLCWNVCMMLAFVCSLSGFAGIMHAHYAGKLGSMCSPVQAQSELRAVLEWLDLLRGALENAPLPYATRNEAEEFARRTRKNLQFVVHSKQTGADVHVVTQLTASLLGLIVYPWEKQFAQTVHSVVLSDLESEGWPHWNISLGAEHCRTLGQLAHRLRNAIAHRRISFSSDSRELEEVDLEFEDQLPGAVAPHWRADIS